MEGRNLSFSPMENLPKRAYVKKFTIGERWCLSAREASSRGGGVSGRGESNPRTRLGRPLHCHCATPASGCWELNPGHILPRDAYCRYTTPRSLNRGNRGSPSIVLRSPLRFRFGDSLRSHPFLEGRIITPIRIYTSFPIYHFLFSQSIV